jgi:hypothetical protein
MMLIEQATPVYHATGVFGRGGGSGSVSFAKGGKKGREKRKKES